MPTTTPSHERLLTYDEAAQRLSVSVETLQRYVKDGRLKGVKLGHGRSSPRRIAESDLVAFMKGLRRA